MARDRGLGDKLGLSASLSFSYFHHSDETARFRYKSGEYFRIVSPTQQSQDSVPGLGQRFILLDGWTLMLEKKGKKTHFFCLIYLIVIFDY